MLGFNGRDAKMNFAIGSQKNSSLALCQDNSTSKLTPAIPRKKEEAEATSQDVSMRLINALTGMVYSEISMPDITEAKIGCD